MTLMISHDAFDGMCSEFHDWRCAVARAAGYDIQEDWAGELAVLDWDAITDDNIDGIWATPPGDPLLVLLTHSDVDGTIAPPDALRLADRLAELLIPAQWRTVTDKFVAACRLAAYRDEPLRFEYDEDATIARLIADHLRAKFIAALSGVRGDESAEHEWTVH